MFFEDLSKNEARPWILEQIQFLRVLTRKLRFSVDMRSQKSHRYWTQLSKAMEFCQNVSHMYILKANKFQVWKNIGKSRSGNLGPKILEIRRNLRFIFVGGPKFENFWNLQGWSFHTTSVTKYEMLEKIQIALDLLYFLLRLNWLAGGYSLQTQPE